MAKASSAREDLIDAAVELFRARGYEGVGVAELLQKSGAPRGSLYFHFPGGKEQIGAEAVARVGAEVEQRFRELRQSGVDLDAYIDKVFKTTAQEVKEREYHASCPMAAIAAEFSSAHGPNLHAAVRGAFNAWQREIVLAALESGMNAKNAEIFASAMLASMEGAFIVSKAQVSPAAHANSARAIKALASVLRAN
ncbi:MAG: TetR/AcrR family transcriptional regulator [Caulobacterales bacterium]|jgi:TetR/AcrR family transcriptional repressor of lmrAB and yxaGH operons|nr:TetR/AcrR family transcriptional regulator [Caulobacterales bacterium]